MLGAMNASQLLLCKRALLELMGDNNKKNNFLFLEPFDLKDAPLHLNSVDKLMDLSLVHRNLAGGLCHINPLVDHCRNQGRPAYFFTCMPDLVDFCKTSAGRHVFWEISA